MDKIEKPIALIVEDNAQLLMVAELMVEEAGCVALPVRNSDEAIVVLRTRRDVAAVFTDVQIPGSMNGVRLAYHIHQNWPHIRLIITSGKGALTEGDLPEGSIFVAKPYDIPAMQALFGQLATAHVHSAAV